MAPVQRVAYWACSAVKTGILAGSIFRVGKVVLCYDITNYQSFQHLEALKQLSHCCGFLDCSGLAVSCQAHLRQDAAPASQCRWRFRVFVKKAAKPWRYIALMANKHDLAHIRAVKVDKHNQANTEKGGCRAAFATPPG